MTKHECRMTKEIEMTKPKKSEHPNFSSLSFVINSAFVISSGTPCVQGRMTFSLIADRIEDLR